MAAFESKKFIYKNSLCWEGEKQGLLSAIDKPGFKVATPPEFRGHPGIWTPEDLFVASVNACIMTTFLFFAEKESIELLGYESESEGILERVENQFMFSEITVRPKILISAKDKVEMVKEIIIRSEKNCLISASVKTRVEVIPEVEQKGA